MCPMKVSIQPSLTTALFFLCGVHHAAKATAGLGLFRGLWCFYKQNRPAALVELAQAAITTIATLRSIGRYFARPAQDFFSHFQNDQVGGSASTRWRPPSNAQGRHCGWQRRHKTTSPRWGLFCRRVSLNKNPPARLQRPKALLDCEKIPLQPRSVVVSLSKRASS